VPFGGTPLHDEMMAAGRILATMPFTFYYAPYLVTTLKNYDPITYYEKLVELYEHASSPAMLRRRVRSTPRRIVRHIHRARTASYRTDVRSFHRVLGMLRSDPDFLAFHEGRTTKLPEFYSHASDRMLGKFGELLSAADRQPDLSEAGPSATARPHLPHSVLPSSDSARRP
jgi:hypothetical protein